tara:strand:- start:866 stop:1114 length:249 start_codon:yes stop_codon:yes gene_type:complete
MAKKENKVGYILSIVAILSKARIKCPGKKQSCLIKNSLEIISLNGKIDHNSCHLHISFSDRNYDARPGQIEEVIIILKLLIC